jgi:hypothetical protein
MGRAQRARSIATGALFIIILLATVWSCSAPERPPEIDNPPVPADVQGRSFLNNLKAQTPVDWRQEIYYHYWQHILHRDVAAHIGVRTKDYKLIFYYGLPMGLTDKEATEPEWEMFDLRSDPMEMNNVYGQPSYQTVQDSLQGRLKQLQTEFDDVMD